MVRNYHVWTLRFVTHGSWLGERTPVRVRMSEPPASIPADWQLCNTSKTFHETVAGYNSTDDGLWYKKVVENRYGIPSEGLWSVNSHWVTPIHLNTRCNSLLGELTDVGKRVRGDSGHLTVGLRVSWQSTHSFGAALRGLYVDRYAPQQLLDFVSPHLIFRLKFLPQTLDNEHLTYFR